MKICHFGVTASRAAQSTFNPLARFLSESPLTHRTPIHTPSSPSHSYGLRRTYIPASPSLASNPTVQRSFRKRLVKPQHTQIRYCSHRRKMCRSHEADASDSSMNIAKGREVLPTNVKPLHYDVTLEPDFKTFEYEGTVAIEYVRLQ